MPKESTVQGLYIARSRLLHAMSYLCDIIYIESNTEQDNLQMAKNVIKEAVQEIDKVIDINS